jgi:hypothetical protein
MRLFSRDIPEISFDENLSIYLPISSTLYPVVTSNLYVLLYKVYVHGTCSLQVHLYLQNLRILNKTEDPDHFIQPLDTSYTDIFRNEYDSCD